MKQNDSESFQGHPILIWFYWGEKMVHFHFQGVSFYTKPMFSSHVLLLYVS